MALLDDDIRNLCHEVVPGPWEAFGYATRLVEGGYILSAQAQGYPRPFEIIVSITKDEPVSCKAIPWYRRLNQNGTWDDESGTGGPVATRPSHAAVGTMRPTSRSG